MKKLMQIVLVILLAVFLVAGCSGNGNVWVWGDGDTNLRAGYLVTDANDTEVGMSVSWQDNNEEPAAIGVYGVVYLPDIVQVPNPIIWKGAPETLNGKPYFGVKVERDIVEKTTNFSPIGGVAIDPFFIEYETDDELVSIGVMFRF